MRKKFFAGDGSSAAPYSPCDLAKQKLLTQLILTRPLPVARQVEPSVSQNDSNDTLLTTACET